METQTIDKLLELIQDIVNDTSQPWNEKRNQILTQAHQDEVTALVEFATWFEDDEPTNNEPEEEKDDKSTTS